jgi:hypothetical protein
MGGGVPRGTGLIRLRRVLRMGLLELASRARREASKGIERRFASPRSSKPLETSGLLDRFRKVGPSRFFAGATDAAVPGFIAQDSSVNREQAVATAEQVCRGRFDLLAYRGLSFGEPVDWELDPVSGRRAPSVHWSLLDPLDPEMVGDSKVVWELNRHQWMVDLGRAYRFTGEERFAETFVRLVSEWMRANPPGVGLNWTSSLEVALRLISWCWALFLFRDSRAFNEEFFMQMVRALDEHARHVAKYLSYYFSPNTHLTGEALGLFYAGVVFPELAGARRWRRIGARILVDEIERQILPDGVYFEQSTYYQCYTVETYLHFLILAARNNLALPDFVRERTMRALDFLLAVSCRDGSVPQIGDADGGSLLPLGQRTADGLRPVFSTASVVFTRGDYAWAASGLRPETLWLLGEPALRAFAALDRSVPTTRASRAFSDGGYAVMRSGWEGRDHCLVFDVGPLGCSKSGGHGHADLLSVECSAFGERFVVDPGMYCYTADGIWRDFFRSTTAHSTVVVDGEPQAVPAGPFAWRDRPSARLRRWVSTPFLDLADADHKGYRRLADPVTHRRRVVFVKPRYWLLIDDLEGAARHRIDLRFQFAPIDVTTDAELWARAVSRRGPGLWIRAFAATRLESKVVEGGIDPIEGWIAPDYGARLPAPVLIYSADGPLPLRVVTLLFPTENGGARSPSVSPIFDENQRLAGLVFPDSGEKIHVGSDEVSVEQGNG